MRLELLIIVSFQVFYSESAAVETEGILTCNTRDGQPGECVHSYLCNRYTNTIIEDGYGILDHRMLNDNSPCPLPMVCCKVDSNDTREGSTSNHTGNFVIENFPPPIGCLTSDGKAGECEIGLDDVLSDTEEDGSNIIDPRMSSDGCPSPFVCREIDENYDEKVYSSPVRPNFFSYVRMARASNRQGCGWRNENGVPFDSNVNLTDEHARPGEFPWVVSIMRLEGAKDNKVSFKYLGGGSLINSRSVLTVAHIFEGISNDANIYVVVGDFYQRTVSVLPRKVIRVEKVNIHEEYAKDVLIKDFALVFLVKPVVVASHVNFVCLPPRGVEMAAGSRCISSGWGNNGLGQHQFIMNKVELPLVDREPCQTQLRNLENLGKYFILDDSFMCALGEVGVDSCKGSGGSPLVCPIQSQPGRYMLSGMVTFSTNCSFDRYPSLYARVASARKWIDDKMADNGYPVTSYTDY